MNKQFIILLMCPFLNVFICIGQEIDRIRSTSWISIDYIKAMEHQLPCQCADSVNYIIQTEPRQYYIISTDSDKYVISETEKNLEDKTFELILKNDTLSLIDGDRNRQYIKSSFPFNNYNSLGFDNITLLNQSLSLRGYPSIQKILKEETLSFDCNAWQGDINMIYSRKNIKSWILEINEGYLYIRKVSNPHRDPLAPIITKVIKVLKWDNEDKNSIPIRKKTKVFEVVKWVIPSSA